MREAPPVEVLIANMPIDGNAVWTGNYGNCVVATSAHYDWILFGKVIPLSTVLKDFKNWCTGNGCTPGWFMWRDWLWGLHGCKIKWFCRIGPNQKDLQWSIDNTGGASLCVFAGVHQILCAGNVGDENHYRFVIWGDQIDIRDYEWKDVIGQGSYPDQLALFSRGHFARSRTFHPYMLWLSAKNNWMWWGFIALCVAAAGYILKAAWL